MTVNPIIFPITVAFLFGTQFVPQKLAGNPKAELYNLSLIIGLTIASIIAFLFFIILEGLKEISIISFFLSFTGGLIWSFGSRLTLIGINNIGMSKSTVILSTISIYSFFLGILFFNENPNIFKFIGVPILMLGAIIVSMISENDKAINRKGVLCVLLAAIFISINNVLTPMSINSNPPIRFFTAVMFLSFGGMLGGFLVNLKPSKLREWKALGKKTHLYGMCAGIIILCGFELTMFTLSEFGLTFGVPIIQSVMIVISALWGILYFKEIKERKKLFLYIIGVGVTFLGVLLFTLQ